MQEERRAHPRILIESDVHYRVMRRGASGATGTGRTINMSSSGLLLTTDQPLPSGAQIEIEMDWPAKRKHGVPQKMILIGRIVRSEGSTHPVAGVMISRHMFQRVGGDSIDKE